MAPGAPLEKILLYVDATEGGVAAARYAVALAEAYGAQIHAVYVVNEKMLSVLRHARVFVEEEELDLKGDLEADGRRYLQGVKRMARRKGVEISTRLRKGTVHAEVVSEADETKASIIVLGELEEPLSIRDSFCNEAEMIMWTSKCPVLIVKGVTLVEDSDDSM